VIISRVENLLFYSYTRICIIMLEASSGKW